MLKLLSATVLGLTMTFAGTGAVQAGFGGCGCQRACAPAPVPSCAAPSCAAPASAPAATPDHTGHDMAQPPVPPSAATTNNGRSTYRSYSFDPGYQAPAYQAPVMRRSSPSTYNQFGADRKIRGAY